MRRDEEPRDAEECRCLEPSAWQRPCEPGLDRLWSVSRWCDAGDGGYRDPRVLKERLITRWSSVGSRGLGTSGVSVLGQEVEGVSKEEEDRYRDHCGEEFATEDQDDDDGACAMAGQELGNRGTIWPTPNSVTVVPAAA